MGCGDADREPAVRRTRSQGARAAASLRRAHRDVRACARDDDLPGAGHSLEPAGRGPRCFRAVVQLHDVRNLRVLLLGLRAGGRSVELDEEALPQMVFAVDPGGEQRRDERGHGLERHRQQPRGSAAEVHSGTQPARALLQTPAALDLSLFMPDKASYQTCVGWKPAVDTAYIAG